MELDAASLRKQIPFYLTAEDQQMLVRELKAVAGGGSANYLLNDYRDSFKDVMLQGDG